MYSQSFMCAFAGAFITLGESQNEFTFPFDDFPSFILWAFSGLLQTLLIYCLPLFLYFCLTKKNHTVKIIRIICAVYAASVWLLLLIVYTCCELSPPGVGPAALWGYGANTLFAKWVYKTRKSEQSTNGFVKETPLETKCAQCGSMIPPNAKFCPSCGGKVPPPVPSGMTVCPSCGKMIEHSRFCPECGAKIDLYDPVNCEDTISVDTSSTIQVNSEVNTVPPNTTPPVPQKNDSAPLSEEEINKYIENKYLKHVLILFACIVVILLILILVYE